VKELEGLLIPPRLSARNLGLGWYSVTRMETAMAPRRTRSMWTVTSGGSGGGKGAGSWANVEGRRKALPKRSAAAAAVGHLSCLSTGRGAFPGG